MNKVFTVAESCYYEQPEIIGTFESIEAADKVVREYFKSQEIIHEDFYIIFENSFGKIGPCKVWEMHIKDGILGDLQQSKYFNHHELFGK